MAHQKTMLVTGCSGGGIGAAIALNLAKKGHFVFATARSPSKIPEELTNLSNVAALQLDIASAPSVAEAAKSVAKTTKARGSEGLDGLVNNAGRGYSMPLLDVNIDKAIQLHDTNVWGVLRTVQAFSDLLIRKRGRVVNVSSLG